MTPRASAHHVPTRATERHRLTAFGLEIESEWPLPGSRPTPRGQNRAEPPTTVRLVESEQLEPAWSEPAERLRQRDYPDGTAYLTVERSHRHYRLWLEDCGRYLVSLDGRDVQCERGSVAEDLRDRFVLAQVLPLAAVLQGYEVLHASAVCSERGATGFVGPSGTGKTSLASRLVLRGADLVADDVVALKRDRDTPLACPGTPFLMIREEDRALLDDPANRLGTVLGKSDKLHVSVPTVDKPVALRRLYFLEHGDRVGITPLEEDNVRRLLACVFVPYLATPERLQRHLETARLLSENVDQFLLRIPRMGGLDTARETVEAHLQEQGP